jgi:hypothetical protein
MDERPPYPQKFTRVVFEVECEWTDEGAVDADLVRQLEQVNALSREDLVDEAIDSLAAAPITDFIANPAAIKQVRIIRGEYRLEEGRVVAYERREL